MNAVIAIGELQPDGSGSVTIGPADYRLEWWLNTETRLHVRVFVEQRLVGHGELRRDTLPLRERTWSGEIGAEHVRYWVDGAPEGGGADRVLRLSWSCPRLPLHEQSNAPEWTAAYRAPPAKIPEE